MPGDLVEDKVGVAVGPYKNNNEEEHITDAIRASGEV
jgi:hypothetical protein